MNKKKKFRFYTHKKPLPNESLPEFLQGQELEVVEVDRISELKPEEKIQDNDVVCISGRLLMKAFRMRDRERSARKILDCVSDAVFLLDSKDEVVWANQSARNMTGKHGNDILHQDIYNLLGNYKFVQNIVPTSVCRKTGGTQKGEFYSIKDRRQFFEMEASPWSGGAMADNDDDVKNVLVIVRDITELRLQAESRFNKLRTIHEIGYKLNSSNLETLDTKNPKKRTPQQRMDILRDDIITAARQLMEHEMFELRRVSENGETLDLFAQRGMLPEIKRREVKIARNGYGINGFVAATRDSYMCPDTQNDPRYLSGGIGSRSSLTVPIMFRDELMGILNVESKRENAFTLEDEMYLWIFSRDIGVALNTFRLMEEGRQEAKEEARQEATKTSVEEIHKTMAVPVSRILESTAKLKPFTENSQEMQVELYNISANAQAIRTLVLRVGRELEMGSVVPAEPEIVPKKCSVLYVDATHEYRQETLEFLQKKGMDVYLTQSGQEALLVVRKALEKNEPYYAILVGMGGVKDFGTYHEFMDALAGVYGEFKIPPRFVLLQKGENLSEGDQVEKICEKYPYCRHLVLPENLKSLPGAIGEVAGELFGKRVLLLDSLMLEEDQEVDSAEEILRRRGCTLEEVSSGRKALEDIRAALSQGQPYSLVIVALKTIADFEDRMMFFDELIDLYAEFDAKPPLVLAMRLMNHDPGHVGVNVHLKLEYVKDVGIPYTEDQFIESLLKVLKSVSEMVSPSDSASESQDGEDAVPARGDI